ncbi:MAG: DUF6603 domain-containing protein [Planctomycetaceae bacterium]
MSSFLAVVAKQLEGMLTAAPLPVPAILSTLGPQIRDLSNLTVDSAESLPKWLEKWKVLATDKKIADTLLVRLIQINLPRLAEILTFLDVIKFVRDAGGDLHHFDIDWNRLSNLLKADTLRSPDTWLDLIFSKLASRDDIKALQVIFGLLLSSPGELLGLEYRKQGFTALPGAAGSLADLSDLMQLINSPLSIPLPVPLGSTVANLRAHIENHAGSTGFLKVDGPDLVPGNGVTGAARLNGFQIGLEVTKAEEFFAAVLPLSDSWSLQARTVDNGRQTYTITLMDGKPVFAGSSQAFEFRIFGGDGNTPALMLGVESESHIKIGESACGLRFSTSEPFLTTTFSARPVEIVLKGSDLARGILGGGLSDSLSLQFRTDFELGIDSLKGWKSQVGGLTVEQAIPLGLNLGVVRIPQLRLVTKISFEAERIIPGLEARLTAILQLGPIEAKFIDPGVSISWNTRREGSPIAIDGLLPAGIGLSITAPPISGSGLFMKLGNGPDSEFGGLLSLQLLSFGVSAFGIYKELKGGEPSFIAIIGIRFPAPGIQLSWGFALSGVGGLIGVNRRANTDLLRERLASGAAGNVLFNDNPAANAPALISDLREFFPDERGVFIVGPTLQITWGVTLISLDLGVFIELPGPRKIFIAGSLRVLIGATPEIALVFLRLDFIGGVDFTTKLIFFDAALVNSHVLQVFRITGGAALRLNYGPNGFFLFTVGGFHPSFNPGSLALPRVARAGAYMSLNVGVKAWLKLEAYFAVTPNTLQMGASVEAGLEIGPLEAHGWFRFDALIQFTPFHFEANIDAGFDVNVEGVSLCGVRVEGMLSGPGPIVISARASVKILFMRISGNVTVRFGSDANDGRPAAIENLLPQLLERFKDPRNSALRSEGEDSWVVLKPTRNKAVLLISPVGKLVWEQRIVPFGRDLTRFEGVPLARRSRLKIEAVDRTTSVEKDWFGAGTYTDMSKSDVLNTSRFAEEQSGLIIGAEGSHDGVSGNPVTTIDLHKIQDVFRIRIGSVVIGRSWSDGLSSLRAERRGFVAPAALADGASAEGKFPRPRIQPDRWKAVALDGTNMAGTPDESVSSVQAWSLARNLGGIAIHATDKRVSLRGVFG